MSELTGLRPPLRFAGWFSGIDGPGSFSGLEPMDSSESSLRCSFLSIDILSDMTITNAGDDCRLAANASRTTSLLTKRNVYRLLYRSSLVGVSGVSACGLGGKRYYLVCMAPKILPDALEYGNGYSKIARQ